MYYTKTDFVLKITIFVDLDLKEIFVLGNISLHKIKPNGFLLFQYYFEEFGECYYYLVLCPNAGLQMVKALQAVLSHARLFVSS